MAETGKPVLQRDKERTKIKLLEAVGLIIKTNGYSGLGVNKIANLAGVHKKQIYDFYGSVEQLIETYVRSKDYWVSFSDKVSDMVNQHKDNYGKELADFIMLNLLDYFYEQEETQKILLWQLSERSDTMYEVSESREKIGSSFFKITDPVFEGTDINIRATSAILIAGIYHLVLHAKSNDSLFCEIDINTPEGMGQIKKQLSRIIAETYAGAERQKQEKQRDRV
jgi:AcrR family transcriptional regulator